MHIQEKIHFAHLIFTQKSNISKHTRPTINFYFLTLIFDFYRQESLILKIVKASLYDELNDRNDSLVLKMKRNLIKKFLITSFKLLKHK